MEPVIIQVLRYLRSNPQGLRREEFVARVGAGEERLQKALEKLVRMGVVASKDGLYCCESTPACEDLFRKLVEVYQQVHKVLDIRLIFRGLLVVAEPGHFLRYNTLRRILEEERLAAGEKVNALLAEEITEGSIERIRVCLGDKWRIRTPFCLPLSSISLFPFIPREYEDFKEGWRKAGFLVQEEDYLRGKYSPEIVQRALRYLEEEGGKIKDKVLDSIKSEVYDNWYRARWFFQLTRTPQSPTNRFPLVLAVRLPPAGTVGKISL